MQTALYLATASCQTLGGNVLGARSSVDALVVDGCEGVLEAGPEVPGAGVLMAAVLASRAR